MYEIERKFLLATMPNDLPVDKTIINISDYYLDSNTRLRWQIIDNKSSYIHVVKKSQDGLKVRKETKRAIEDNDEIHRLMREADSRILKTRYQVKANGLQWEIDEYKNLALVVAEVEQLSETKDSLKIDEAAMPDFISSKLIMEVTDMPQFYNYNLSQLTDY